MEANHPARGLLLRVTVQVFAVQVGEETLGVARVLFQQLLGFSRLQHKANTSHVIANECLAFVARQAGRFAFGLVVEAGGDEGDGVGVEKRRALTLSPSPSGRGGRRKATRLTSTLA